MAKLGINTGSNPNDGQGDPLRVAMGKINSNFSEIYDTFGDGSVLTSYASTSGISTVARNLTGSPIIAVNGILNSGITTTEHIEVRNITSTGIITAVQFVGDGSQLENVVATSSGVEVLDDNVRKGVAKELNFGGGLFCSGPDGVGRVTIAVTTSIVSGGGTVGTNLEIRNQNVILGEFSKLNFGPNLLAYVNPAVGIVTVTTSINQLNLSGVVTASKFFGDGSTLTGVVTSISGYAFTNFASVAGISTLSQGLTGNPNISVNQVGISSYLTVSGVSTFYNNIHIDYDKFLFVGANDELQIFHDGANSYIDNFSSNSLVIRDNGAGIQLRRYGGGPSAGLMANFNTGAGVELYYDSVLKLQTFQNGVAINDSVGIGTTAGNPPYRLTVSGIGATITQGLLNAIADLTSSVDGYGQVNIRNSLSAPNASGDLVITADIGDDTSNYIDLGVNNTGFSTSSWTINGPLDGYLYSSDSNLSVGVAETNKYFSIFAGGTLIENEKIRVTETGVGIGTTNPTSDFHVQGDLFASGVIITTDALFTGIVTSGISIPTQLRTKSVAEKTTLISGNTVGLAFTAGGGNVAICTNPSGDITLNVTGIPTDSSFDNHSISFSVVVNQTGTSRTCTSVNLNGVSRTIRWAGGSLANAISGVTTISGFDIFTFTGINTVGSASTTANYVILGSVNGGFN